MARRSTASSWAAWRGPPAARTVSGIPIRSRNWRAAASISEVKSGVDQAQGRADEAYAKATLAERLANGYIEYEVVSTHRVQFDFDDYRLTSEAELVLDDLGAKLASYPRYVLEIRGYADEVVCLHAPAFFQAVGQFYRNFPQVEDEEVIAILSASSPGSRP